jgi:hypothetical protein
LKKRVEKTKRVGAVAINRRECSCMIVDVPVDAHPDKLPLIYRLDATRLVERHRFDVDDMTRMEHVIELLPESLNSCERLGLSSFGPFMSLDAVGTRPDLFGLISRQQSELAGDERNIVKLLRDKTGVWRVDLTTDANAVALGELADRLSRGFPPFTNITHDDKVLKWHHENAVIVSLIFGRGVGGGVAIAGRTLQHSYHPEIGHIRVPIYTGDHANDTKCAFHGDCITGYASRDRFVIKDNYPTDESLERFAHYAAHLISTVTYALAPHLVALAGSTIFEYPEVVGRIRAALHRLMMGRRDNEALPPLVPVEDKDQLDSLIEVAAPTSYLLGALAHTLNQMDGGST